jgi:hypothetical protein
VLAAPLCKKLPIDLGALAIIGSDKLVALIVIEQYAPRTGLVLLFYLLRL